MAPRLEELARRHQVPGASLAVLTGGEVTALATGVLHKGTGVEVTTDSLFQIGSMTKAYTATVVLCHTSGINGDFFLPEDVLRFRAAMGHVTGSPGEEPQPASSWYEMRSVGPVGLVCATAADAAAFARLHLDDGRAPDGTRVLAASTVAEMQHPQVAVPNPYPMASHWGLGWALSDWGGRRVVGHDGDTIGQSAFLRVVPDAGVAVVLLTNSDRTGALYREVFSELLAELCDLTMPPPLEPPATPPEVDLRRHVGVYERVGMRMEATLRDGDLFLEVTPTGVLADLVPAFAVGLVPLTDTLLVGRPPMATRWMSYVFYRLPDGTAYLHDGARATPKVS